MRLTLFLVSFLALQTAPAFAQDAMPKCDGDIAVVRVSEIKPGGTMKGVMTQSRPIGLGIGPMALRTMRSSPHKSL
jgi:hypothetical protein